MLRRAKLVAASCVQARNMRIAVIGQSNFGKDVYRLLQSKGHDIVGVFTIPDVKGKPDPLAQAAEEDGVKVFKYPRWRTKGTAIPEVVEEFKACGSELNVLPFCSQFIPMEVIDSPRMGSIIYHPSILPRHRGASAINWTLIQGDKKAGFTIFHADDGLDTGPILLTKECWVDPNDTVDSIYNRFLYPQGVLAMAEAVDLIEKGKAPKIVQPSEGASYDPMMKKSLAKIDWSKSAQEIHNFIRGCDMLPGAWTMVGDHDEVTLLGSTLWTKSRDPRGDKFPFASDLKEPALRHRDGLLITCADGQKVNVSTVSVNGKLMPASKFGSHDEVEDLVLTEEEYGYSQNIREIWAAILNRKVSAIDGDTDFFKAGAASMDVTRLVEEVRDVTGVEFETKHVYMATTFEEFIQLFARKFRGETEAEFHYDAVVVRANNRELKFPNQLFINNEFVDARSGKTMAAINPTDESKICDVACALEEDVDDAVDAASAAFRHSDWSTMNARDRGHLMYRLADLLEHNKEDLATLETLDSGAVYTLALKTHIGMSIDTWRYYAGWCDKIQGSTIPINHAKPNKNLTFTKREPFGVVGLIVPWNYPFMMLSWKMAAAIAAGNTVVLKPAHVTPLTAIKFGEFVAKAGFPPGVINIVPGGGSTCGQRILDHPDVRKVGFTGSTGIGKVVMGSCASTVKKCSLELGGKSPLIIFSDANLDKAVKFALSGCFFNKGENCIASGRLFVESAIHDEFVHRVIEETSKMKIGDPLDRSVAHGPQNHEAHLQSLLKYVETGVNEGATLVYGGKRLNRPGYFMEPAIFTDVEDHMFIAKEESFGPVMIISKFDDGDIDGVLRSANGTEFGLASGVFTQDVSKALLVSDRLEAGTVFVNTYNKTDVAAPFGGFKQSGFGKDLGEEALNEYLKTKAVTVEY